MVRVCAGDEWKTVFRIEYTVMLFGLTNAPSVFKHFMHDLFQNLLDQFMVIYLDNILLYSSSLQEHWKHVRLVLQCLQDNHLFAKREVPVHTNHDRLSGSSYLACRDGDRPQESRVVTGVATSVVGQRQAATVGVRKLLPHNCSPLRCLDCSPF